MNTHEAEYNVFTVESNKPTTTLVCSRADLTVFCKDAEETLFHMFWNCPQTQDCLYDIQGLDASFTRFTEIIFSKELVILGSEVNTVSDRILDLCILIAKYNIFT